MADKYKIWLVIEKTSNVGERNEDHDNMPTTEAIGSFDTLEAADQAVRQVTEWWEGQCTTKKP